jgi:MFS family permease
MDVVSPPVSVSLSATATTKKTYLYDRLRSGASGVIDSAASTFLLLIAVKAFEAGTIEKSFIAASGNIGLLLSLWLVPLAERMGKPVMRIASWMMLAGGAAMLVAAGFASLPMLVAASIAGIGAANAIIPLLTLVYQNNYLPRERGKYVSRTFVPRVAATILFGELAGRLLTYDINLFRVLLVAFAIAFFFAAFCLARIPSTALHGRTVPPPPAPPPKGEGREAGASGSAGVFLGALGSLKYLRTDRTLRWTLASWMLMGFANLMMWPLRVEFLANPKYGLVLSPQAITLYVITIPSLMRLLLSPVWGVLFDRMNFFVLRIILNVGFALGIAAFFTGNSTMGLVLGALIFGIANAGGEVAWNLWVTKFAPHNRVAEYMSVHTFFTGIRGIAAPFIAFQLTQTLDIAGIAVVCAILILLASLILIPEARGEKRRMREAV